MNVGVLDGVANVKNIFEFGRSKGFFANVSRIMKVVELRFSVIFSENMKLRRSAKIARC